MLTIAYGKYEYVYISAIRKLNQLFIRDSYTQIEFSKNWISMWQKSGFYDRSILYFPFNFSSPFSAWCPLKGHTYLNKPAADIDLWPDSFAFICSTLSKKSYIMFLRKVLVLKTFKILGDCHIKTCRYLKRKAILKIPSILF